MSAFQRLGGAQGVQALRDQQRLTVQRSLNRLRKQSLAPAAEIALMSMALHESRRLERDTCGNFNFPDAQRYVSGDFVTPSFSAATVQRLIRAGRVEVEQFNENGAPTRVVLKPM